MRQTTSLLGRQYSIATATKRRLRIPSIINNIKKQPPYHLYTTREFLHGVKPRTDRVYAHCKVMSTYD